MSQMVFKILGKDMRSCRCMSAIAVDYKEGENTFQYPVFVYTDREEALKALARMSEASRREAVLWVGSCPDNALTYVSNFPFLPMTKMVVSEFWNHGTGGVVGLEPVPVTRIITLESVVVLGSQL